MGKFSQIHADSAPDRAESAETDNEYYRDMMRGIASQIEAVRAALINPSVCQTVDIMDELYAIATDLRIAAGDGEVNLAATASKVADSIETGDIGF